MKIPMSPARWASSAESIPARTSRRARGHPALARRAVPEAT
jgi:hypothetical protein